MCDKIQPSWNKRLERASPSHPSRHNSAAGAQKPLHQRHSGLLKVGLNVASPKTLKTQKPEATLRRLGRTEVSQLF